MQDPISSDVIEQKFTNAKESNHEGIWVSLTFDILAWNTYALFYIL